MEYKEKRKDDTSRLMHLADFSDYSDVDLKEMIGSLRITVESCDMQIAAIERELKKREGSSPKKTEQRSRREEIEHAVSLDPVEMALVSTIEVRKVETEGCMLCGLCSDVCPWQAPIIIDKKLIVRQERCRGCGACVAACPSRAIDMKVYKTEDLLELISYVLKEDVLIDHPDSVNVAVAEAQAALMNIEKILSHRVRDNRVENMLHTLKQMVERIDKIGDQLKGVQKDKQATASS
jgi:ferredoxin